MLKQHVTRRDLLKLAGGAALTAAVGACSVGGGSSGGKSQLQRVRMIHTQAGDTSMTAWYTNAVNEFNRTHKGIEIVAEYTPFSGAYQKILAAIQAGTPPDILHGDSFVIGAMLQGQYAAPVTNVIKAMGWDSDLMPDLRIRQKDGNDYVIPTWIEILGLYYRKDWAADAGVTVPMKSWDEVIAAARAMQQPGRGWYGISMPLKRSGMLGEQGLTILNGLGGHLYNPDKTPAVDSQAFRDTADILRSLAQYTSPEAAQWEYGGIRTAFEQGKVGLHIYQPRTMLEILGDAGGGYGSGYSSIVDKVGFQLTPPKDAANWPNRALSGGSNEGFMILKDSPFRDAAETFLKWNLGDRARYMAMCNATPMHEMPVLQSVAKDDSFYTAPAWKKVPEMKPVLQQAALIMGTGPEENIKIDAYRDQRIVIPETGAALGGLVLEDALLSYIVQRKPINDVIGTLSKQLADLVKK